MEQSNFSSGNRFSSIDSFLFIQLLLCVDRKSCGIFLRVFKKPVTGECIDNRKFSILYKPDLQLV